MTLEVTMYHNPNCSKSRDTLTILQNMAIRLNVINYLETPPDAKTLKILLQQLGFSSARQLMRVKDHLYSELHLADLTLSEEQLITTMVAHPKLIERPIVVCKHKARLGRPPEQVLEIIE